jgi:hypothetical protein
MRWEIAHRVSDFLGPFVRLSSEAETSQCDCEIDTLDAIEYSGVYLFYGELR